MNRPLLARALRDVAYRVDERVDPATGSPTPEDADIRDLLRVLAHLVEGKSIERAFGAPGDWGYGTPIGDALAAATPATDQGGQQPCHP